MEQKHAGTACSLSAGTCLSARPFPCAPGLMYEDCLIETEEVKLALKRLPPELLNAREQRLKRAMVLSSQIKTVS